MIVTCLAAAYFWNQIADYGLQTWYETITKPSFAPPKEIFAPVWGFFFVLIGLGGGLFYAEIERTPEPVRKGMLFFWIQLALAILWAYLFFSLKNPLLATIEIALTWLIAYETYVQFGKINKFSSILFIPYLLWLAFITALSATIWFINS